MGHIPRAVGEFVERSSVLCLLVGLALSMPEAYAAEPSRFTRAGDRELLLGIGRSATMRDAGRPGDSSLAPLSLGMIDPLVGFDVERILDIPSSKTNRWLGLFNGAFYFVTPEQTLKMVDLETGSLVSLGTVNWRSPEEGFALENRRSKDGLETYVLYDLRRRVRRTGSMPTLPDDGWRSSSEWAKGLRRLYLRVELDEELQSLVVTIRVYDLAADAWGIERFVRFPLYSAPYELYIQPESAGHSSLVFSGAPSPEELLVLRWYDEEHLVVRAPSGILDSVDAEQAVETRRLGLWVLNVRTGEGQPIEFESLPFGRRDSGQNGHDLFRRAFALIRDDLSFRAVCTSEPHGYRVPYGPFYAIQSSSQASGLLCGNAVLGKSIVVSDGVSRHAGVQGREELHLSPSALRVAFKTSRGLQLHDMPRGRLSPYGEFAPIGWVDVDELRYVPGELRPDETPFSELGTAESELSVSSFVDGVMNRREVTAQLKLEAAFLGLSDAESADALVELTITNEGEAGVWLLPPDSPMALRGTLVAPGRTDGLAAWGAESDEAKTPEYVEPGASLVSKMRIGILGEGSHLLVPGYHYSVQDRADLLLSGAPIRFEIEKASIDTTEKRLAYVIDTYILDYWPKERHALGVLSMAAQSAQDKAFLAEAEETAREREKARERAEQELLLYPSQSAQMLKKRILSLAEQQLPIDDLERHLGALYLALGVLGGAHDIEFVLDRLENGGAAEQEAVVLLMKTAMHQGYRPRTPYSRLLDGVRRTQETNPALARKFFLTFFRRMPASFEAEDLVRPLLDDPQQASRAKRYILKHRASQGLQLNEECLAIIEEFRERSEGGTLWPVVEVLTTFHRNDPTSGIVRDEIDKLLPEHREAIQRHIRTYAALGSDWLRYAATHPTKERLDHARIVIGELEEVSGENLGELPEGAWNRVETSAKKLNRFEETLAAWANYIDANEIDVKIP